MAISVARITIDRRPPVNRKKEKKHKKTERTNRRVNGRTVVAVANVEAVRTTKTTLRLSSFSFHNIQTLFRNRPMLPKKYNMNMNSTNRGTEETPNLLWWMWSSEWVTWIALARHLTLSFLAVSCLLCHSPLTWSQPTYTIHCETNSKFKNF